MSTILVKLNDKQKEAVTATKGPVLVIAGAGSGKTRALTHRIAYMIQEEGINPWNILAVTFTNKAAGEMKERITKLLQKPADSFETEMFPQNEYGNPNQDLPTIGTFHSVCVRILRKHIQNLGYENTFVIYDAADQQVLIKRTMEELRMDPKQINPKSVLHQISNAKNQLVTPDQYAPYVNNYFTEKVAEVYKHYQNALQKNNALDFDDIIMKTVELYQQFPQILDEYQEKFRYISVDEYQDTNHAQYILINLLAKKYRNICVIGDSDQSIYAFRGANIGNILNFEKDYPEAKTVLLEQNYRSTQNILDAAHAIIIKNQKRKEKKLWTENTGGEKVIVKALDNERGEAEFIIYQINKNLEKSEYKDLKQFVVLYRTNAQSRVLEEAFLRHGIAYKIIGGIRFYERKEIKDLISYLRVIQNPHDSVSLLRIINVPARKIGAKSIEALQAYAFRNNISFFDAMSQASQVPDLDSGKISALNNFLNLINDLKKINTEFSASGVIKHVLDLSGYKNFIVDGSVEGESRLENIYELISVSSKYDSLEPGISLNIFLEEIALIADVDSMNEQDNSVTFMTIHSAKGLEFPVVFIAGLEEGILPHSRSLLEKDELEEERRLMYVAITRAKEKIYLLRAKNRMLYGEYQANLPSQFINDIPDDIAEKDESSIRTHKTLTASDLHYTPVPVEQYDQEEAVELFAGDRVNHAAFGTGTVSAITGGVATVAFDNPKYGSKKLALSIAPLRKI